MIDKNLIWVEKYRPKTLEDLVLEPTTREFLEKCLKDDYVSHLLLSGNVGCGKTTIAKILLKKLDCESITLNASDERGIETVRNKIKQFAMMSSFKKWKIVFLDEADNLTAEAQFSLRNLMETYAEQTRFILTCNYLNRIIEPIKSRCQLVEFKNLQRKQIRMLLDGIFKIEQVEYSPDDLLLLIDMFYPDIRSMINNMQQYSNKGQWTLKNIAEFRNFERMLEFIKKKDLKGIRELEIEYIEAFKYLFDKVDELTEDYAKRVEISVLIAEYLYRDWGIADKSINFAACMLQVMEKL